MGDYVHRATKAYYQSMSPNKLPDLPLTNYIEDPDFSNVTGYPSIYWITYPFPNDTIDLMDQAARDAVDAQILSDQRDAIIAELDNTQEIGRQSLRRVLLELNILRERDRDWQAAVANAANLSQLKDAIALLPSLDDRTFVQFKTWMRNELDGET